MIDKDNGTAQDKLDAEWPGKGYVRTTTDEFEPWPEALLIWNSMIAALWETSR